MIAQPIPDPPIPSFGPTPASKPPSGGQPFAEALDQAQAAASPPAVDPADERAALLELLHLEIMLTAGLVDPGVFTAGEPPEGFVAGPVRMEVENLKACLRNLMSGPGVALVRDPRTGKLRSSGAGLQALWNAVPPELRALVKRAFPDLAEQRRMDPGAFGLLAP